jgi:DNA-binding XRE family transcriptional regulator
VCSFLKSNLIIAQKCYKGNKKYLDKLRKSDNINGNLLSYPGGEKVIKTDDLRGVIAKNGLSQTDVARMIGITPKTFYEKMKNGVFGSDEIQIMIEKLNIEDPVSIFFAKE